VLHRHGSFLDEVCGEMGMLLHMGAGWAAGRTSESTVVRAQRRRSTLSGSGIKDVIANVWLIAFLDCCCVAAADRSNLELGVLNLETLERQEPPPGGPTDQLC
jgi:hypothetical protein